MVTTENFHLNCICRIVYSATKSTKMKKFDFFDPLDLEISKNYAFFSLFHEKNHISKSTLSRAMILVSFDSSAHGLQILSRPHFMLPIQKKSYNQFSKKLTFFLVVFLIDFFMLIFQLRTKTGI